MSRPARAAIATLAALAGLATAPAAHASSVTLNYNFRDYHGLAISYGGILEVRAADGELNDLTVTFTAGKFRTGVYEIHDAGAPLGVGKECDRVDDHTARCGEDAGALPQHGELGDYQGIEAVDVSLGDGDDALAVASFPFTVSSTVHGGAGNDKITLTGPADMSAPSVFGDAGDDTLTGGPGADLLVGGRGSDTLDGGPGRDVLGDDGHEADSYDGGAGLDVVNYQSTRVPVRIDLGAGRGQDGDTYTRVESAIGGHKGDTILGDDGPNDLIGGPGRDRIAGRGGADRLEGDGEPDKLSGGAGGDRLYSSEGADPGIGGYHELIHCGTGDDVVRNRDGGDRLGTDCEGAGVRGDGSPGLVVIQPLRIGPQKATGLGLRCTPDAAQQGCEGTITLQAGWGKRAVTIGTGTAKAAPGQTTNVPIRLKPGAAAALGPGGLQRVTVAVKLKAHLVDTTDPADPSPYTAKYRDSVLTFAVPDLAHRRGLARASAPG
jgi:hypothetical protein